VQQHQPPARAAPVAGVQADAVAGHGAGADGGACSWSGIRPLILREGRAEPPRHPQESPTWRFSSLRSTSSTRSTLPRATSSRNSEPVRKSGNPSPGRLEQVHGDEVAVADPDHGPPRVLGGGRP
jgi:hypothetical protein